MAKYVVFASIRTTDPNTRIRLSNFWRRDALEFHSFYTALKRTTMIHRETPSNLLGLSIN